VTDLTHCRPIINVDVTILAGKYKSTLMVVVDMTAKNQLLPHAFALVEGQNNESWSWFLGLVRKKVLSPGKSICMILNHHRGLQWCFRHFAANIWKK
jgi:hypothetical protein